MSWHEASPGSCLSLPQCLLCYQSLSARGGTWVLLSVSFAMSPVPGVAGAAGSRGECGGGMITCCEQHFCLTPSCWGWKPTVLGNLSSYSWLCMSGLSKETEEEGQRGQVAAGMGAAKTVSCAMAAVCELLSTLLPTCNLAPYLQGF